VKEELRKEVECLRVELKQVRDDRDHSVIQLNSLNIELGKYKEEIGKTSKECESFRRKVSELEVCSFRFILVSVMHNYWA
jgi:kinesin family protein C1